MGHDEEGLIELFVQFADEFVEHGGVGLVQVAAGLVGQHQVGVVHEGTGNSHTLAFTTGKFPRQVFKAVLEAYRLQQHLGAFTTFLLGSPENPARHAHVLDGRKFTEQVMELENETHLHAVVHVPFLAVELGKGLALEKDFTGSRRIQHAHQVQEGGLARTRRTGKSHQLPRFHLKVHALENLKFFACLGEHAAEIDSL